MTTTSVTDVLTRANAAMVGPREDVTGALAQLLAGVLDVLDDDERETFTDLLAKLLARLYAEIGDADVMCRLCDRRCCVAGAVCPVGQAERDAAGDV